MRWTTKLGKIKRDDNGAATIEFAILAMPFFMLFIGIIEIGLCYFFENTLVHGMESAIREVRVGTNFDAPAFKTKVCDTATVLPDCDNSLYIRLIETDTSLMAVSSLQSAVGVCRTRFSSPPPSGTPMPAEVDGTITNPETVVTAVACYKWNFFTPMMGKLLGTETDDSKMIAVAFAFMTEPF